MKDSVEVGDAFKGVAFGTKKIPILIITSEDTCTYYYIHLGWRHIYLLTPEWKSALTEGKYYERIN